MSAEVAEPVASGRHRMQLDVRPQITHIPGGWLELQMAPAPRWPVVLRNTRALHGVVTGLLGQPHHPTEPRFALAPWPFGIGWRVFVHDEAAALRVAARTVDATLYGAPVLVRVGSMLRQSAPHVWRERMLVVDTITPVCTRGAGKCWGEKTEHAKRAVTTPTAAGLISTVAAWLPRRIGYEAPESGLSLELVAHQTRAERVQLGGKFPPVDGWSGRLVMRCNAAMAWLLELAETVGLGGRCAYGFGRVRVREA